MDVTGIQEKQEISRRSGSYQDMISKNRILPGNDQEERILLENEQDYT